MPPGADGTVADGLARSVLRLGQEAIPNQVRSAARLRVVDALSCMALGSRTASAQAALRLAQRWSPADGQSRVIGARAALSSPWAGFVNAVAAHTLEFDDAHDDTSVQPGAAVVATALALADSRGSSGETFLRAVLAGYETSLALGTWFAPSHKELGYHPTATLTTIGATAAACVVRKADLATTRAALAIATSMASGLLEFARADGTVNHLHTGKATLLGMLALEAAEEGFSGPSTAYEGTWGLQSVQTTEPRAPWPGLDDQWRVLNVVSKPYPTCRAAHPPMIAAERLHPELARRGLPDEVVVRVPSQCFRQTNHPEPADTRQRQFSTQFGVAVALGTGGASLLDYQDERRAAEHQPLMRRVHLMVDTAAPASQRSAQVTLRYADGASVVSTDGASSQDSATEAPSAEHVLRRRLDRAGAGMFQRTHDLIAEACERPRLGSLAAEFDVQLADLLA
jgi:2-methylcitrate dehydratase PrpD